VRTARFVTAARLEFLAEIHYYNTAQPGLGGRFASAIEEATARALAYPRSGSPSRSNTRKLVLKDFPFSLIYREEPGGVVIFAVAHHTRHPYYWQARTKRDG
jgi:toxin ParE1/3/4